MSDTTEANAVAYLRSVFTYEPDTGVVRWKIRKANRLRGSIAGSVKLSGYRYIGIDRWQMRAGRVIWALSTGRFPEHEVDHIDGNRDNNRWSNLRVVTHRQNAFNRGMYSNNTSGYKGVSKVASTGGKCWHASIGIERKRIVLGRYKTPREASVAYELAAREIYGEFYRPPPRRPHVQLDYHPLQMPTVATHTRTAPPPPRRRIHHDGLEIFARRKYFNSPDRTATANIRN